MGGSLWDQVGLPLIIGVGSQIAVAALRFLSVRLWNCLMQQQIEAPAAVGERAHDQPLPGSSGAATHANGEPDLETGNDSGGPAEGEDQLWEDKPERECWSV